MPEPIDISPAQLETVKKILSRYVPECEVRAFGSRVTWTAKEFSDLDLAIMTDKPLDFAQIGALQEAFTESDLPFKVDLIDWATIGEGFRKIIDSKFSIVQIRNRSSGLSENEDDDWKTTTLGQITIWSSGGTPRKNNRSYWNGNIPWISASSMKKIKLFDSDLKITESGLENGSRLAERGSVLLLVRGSELHKRIPVGIAERSVAFNQDVKALKTKEGVLPEYVLYWLIAKERLLLSKVEPTGIGAGKLDTKIMKELILRLPPISIQRSIVQNVVILDEKIELNFNINKTLEAMARALFKSWFVEFDPVHAKAEGCDTGLTKEISDLFPSAFQDSELGAIPKGWEIRTLSNFSSLNPESWSRDTRPENINYIDLSNTKWGRIETVSTYLEQDAPSRAQRVLRQLDTIVGTVRPGNGSYAFITEEGLTGSTGFAVLRPRKDEYAELVYLAVTTKENIEFLEHVADGGAYPAVRPEVVATTQVICPSQNIIKEFSKRVAPLLRKIAQNERESRALFIQREALLPKLISGKLRVPVGKNL
jgi:type I restriction enzyme S subunit